MGAEICRVSEIQSLESVYFLLNKSALRASSSSNIGEFRTCAATESMLVGWYIHPLGQSIHRQIWVGWLVPVEGRRKHLLDLGLYRYRYSFQETTKLAECKCSVLWDGWFWHNCWPPLHPVLVGSLSLGLQRREQRSVPWGVAENKNSCFPQLPQMVDVFDPLLGLPAHEVLFDHTCVTKLELWWMSGVLLSPLAQTSGYLVLNSCR